MLIATWELCLVICLFGPNVAANSTPNNISTEEMSNTREPSVQMESSTVEGLGINRSFSEMLCNVTDVLDNTTVTGVGNCTEVETISSNNSADAGATVDTSKSSSGRKKDRYGGQLSKDEYDYYKSILDPIRFTLHLLAAPVLILTVVGFIKNRHLNVCNRFIIALSVFELFSTVLNIGFYTLKYAMEPTEKIFVVWVLICNYGIICCRRIVYVLNLLLSMQRLIAVTSPMKSRTSLIGQGKTIIFIGVPIFIFVFHIYVMFMYIAKEIAPGMYVQSRSTYYTNHELLFDGLGYFSKTAFSYSMLFLSLCVNILLICFLKRHNDKFKSLRTNKEENERSRQDRQMTIMILVTTLAFTILSLPANLNQMINSISSTYGTRKQDHYLYGVIKTGVNATHSVADLINFLTYLTLSNTFRQQLLGVFTIASKDRTSSKVSGTNFLEDGKTGMSSVARSASSFSDIQTSTDVQQED